MLEHFGKRAIAANFALPRHHRESAQTAWLQVARQPSPSEKTRQTARFVWQPCFAPLAYSQNPQGGWAQQP